MRTGALNILEGKTLQPTSDSILTSLASTHILQAVSCLICMLNAIIGCVNILSSMMICMTVTRFMTPGDDEVGQINEFIVLLMRRGLILRVDRMYKKPKPGKKRLTKWPKKLVPVRDKSMLVSSCSYTVGTTV